VIPQLQIACIDEQGLWEMETGGENRHKLFDHSQVPVTQGLARDPSGTRFAMAVAPGLQYEYPYGLKVALTIGYPATQQLSPMQVPGLLPGGQYWPQFDRQGAWIYFSQRLNDFDGTEIWRARPDGSLAEQLTQLATSYSTDINPSPSPDGSRLVFATDRRDPHSGSFYELALLDLTTRVLTISAVRGVVPRWSPDGATIAYFDELGRIALANSSLTSARALTAAPPFAGGLAWSADGNWLIAGRTEQGLSLVDAQTGAVLPLVHDPDCGQAVFTP